MRAFKFVDPAHSDAVAAGRLRIGSFTSYAKLESPRRDDMEGAVIANFTGIIGPTDTLIRNRLADFAAPFNFNQTYLDIVFRRNKSILPDMYCFCMSKRLSARPQEPHAAFEIVAVRELCRHLTQLEGERLGKAGLARTVSYERRVGDLTELALRPDPFMKDVRFRHEEEYRIVWYNPPRKILHPSDQSDEIEEGTLREKLEPFVTRENAYIASLLKRVY